MAKPIILKHAGTTSSFPFAKLERKKLYATRKRIVLDRQGEPCRRVDLMSDGSTLIYSGMTGQGYFDDENVWVPNADLVGLDAEGNTVKKVPSTLGEEQELEGPVPPEELLDMAIYAVYQLDASAADEALKQALDGGKIFRFPFNYRPDYHTETGYLVGNDVGVFALIGNRVEPAWCELDKPVVDMLDDEDDDDLDFEMF